MPQSAEKSNPRWRFFIIIFVILLASYIIWALTAAIPSVQPTTTFRATNGIATSSNLAWPAYGQAAIGINNLGVIASNGNQKPSPTASVAKLITALVVLQKYPLSVNQSGPIITLTPADVVLYDTYQSEDGSDMMVYSGERLSEYQMLEAMLLPSADNIADSLAIWAYGSLVNYANVANQYLKQHGLLNSHVGSDASGYDPNTTSTATDLVKLGELAMDNPVIANIVAQPSASGIPAVGNIYNVNRLLGRDNIIGIKTGNTNQAGGVYLSASKINVNNQPLIIITAVMQAPTLYDAMASSLNLISSAQTNFSTPPNIASVTSGSIVGDYFIPWTGQTITAVAKQPIEIVSWGGSIVDESIILQPISYKAQPGQIVGQIMTTSKLLKYSQSTPIILSRSSGSPSRWWVLLHPGSFIHF